MQLFDDSDLERCDTQVEKGTSSAVADGRDTLVIVEEFDKALTRLQGWWLLAAGEGVLLAKCYAYGPPRAAGAVDPDGVAALALAFGVVGELPELVSEAASLWEDGERCGGAVVMLKTRAS